MPVTVAKRLVWLDVLLAERAKCEFGLGIFDLKILKKSAKIG
jgi:hypothetical protein